MADPLTLAGLASAGLGFLGGKSKEKKQRKAMAQAQAKQEAFLREGDPLFGARSAFAEKLLGLYGLSTDVMKPEAPTPTDQDKALRLIDRDIRRLEERARGHFDIKQQYLKRGAEEELAQRRREREELIAAQKAPVPPEPAREPIDPTSFLEQLPGYQFTQQQGMKAIERAASSRGELFGGGVLADLAKYTTGLASQTYGGEVDRLMRLAGVGTATPGQLAATVTPAPVSDPTAGLGNVLGELGMLAAGRRGAPAPDLTGEAAAWASGRFAQAPKAATGASYY